MGREIAARVAALLPVLLGIAVITFMLMRFIPGDAIAVLLDEHYDAETAAVLRRQLGLDEPLHVQFWEWFSRVVRGDMGVSLRTGRPVVVELLERFPATALLTVASLFVALAIAIPVGVLSAVWRNTPIDMPARVASLVGLSLPNFWQAILLIMVFAVGLRVLPSGGYAPLTAGVGESLRFLILPALTLGTALAAVTMRMTRSTLLEVLSQEYVRTARAKGLRERIVILRHSLRNALIPVVTVIGIQTANLLGGTVVIEHVFAWPGLGTLIVRGILQRDFALVQGAVMFLALTFVVVNLIVDVLYVYLDPRLRRA